MASPDPRADSGSRALDARPRLRVAAIALWSGFLGAALATLTALALLPPDAIQAAGWTEISVGFLCAWAIALVPVTLALMLALAPPPAKHGHGR